MDYIHKAMVSIGNAIEALKEGDVASTHGTVADSFLVKLTNDPDMITNDPDTYHRSLFTIANLRLAAVFLAEVQKIPHPPETRHETQASENQETSDTTDTDEDGTETPDQTSSWGESSRWAKNPN